MDRPRRVLCKTLTSGQRFYSAHPAGTARPTAERKARPDQGGQPAPAVVGHCAAVATAGRLAGCCGDYPVRFALNHKMMKSNVFSSINPRAALYGQHRGNKWLILDATGRAFHRPAWGVKRR
jgi:hypothetical protein